MSNIDDILGDDIFGLGLDQETEESMPTEPTSIRAVVYLGGFERDPKNWTTGINGLVDLHNHLVGPDGSIRTDSVITARAIGAIRRDAQNAQDATVSDYLAQFADWSDDRTLIVVVRP